MTEPEPLQMVGDNQVRWRNRTLLYFSGCDYFRLSRHPKVVSAASAILKKSDLNVAASRLTTGNRQIYAALEHELAAFFGVETATLFPDGYLAPIGAVQAVAIGFTHAFIDSFSHAALVDASRMFPGRVKPFDHRNPSALARAVSKLGPHARPLVLTDGMFSHDGSVAPLADYLKILPPSGMILVDDAHGAGILGATGKGSLEHIGVSRDRIIHCATLSKAFGAYGGVVLGPRALRKKILWTRPFAGSTPLPPPLAAAALAAIKLLRLNPGRRKRLFQNVSWLRNQLREAGWDLADAPGPVIRLPHLNAAAERELKKRLLAAGIYPPFVKYGKASAEGIFRFVISSEHEQSQLGTLAKVLATFRQRNRTRFDMITRHEKID